MEFCDSFPFPPLLYYLHCQCCIKHEHAHHTCTHEDTILLFLWIFFFFHDHYICRKTWNSFFMTTAFEEKLENFKELIICIIRYIKYLVEKQGCKQWTLNPIFLNLSLCFVLLWCVYLTLWALLCVVTAYLCSM